MGPQEDYIETVFTCEGDINDPNLQSRLEDFRKGLRDLLSTDKRKLILKKVEPWNSVRVTFNIPREAAHRLKQLAQQGDSTLRQLGVLAVQIEGDQIISLTIAGRNNERTRLVFRTESDTVDAPSVSMIDPGGRTNDFETPGPSNAESTTQKNIADYLRQGAPLFDTLFGQQSSAPDGFQSSGPRDVMPFASMGMPSSATGRGPSQSQQSFGFPQGKNPTSAQSHQSGFFPFDQQTKGSLGQPGMKMPSPPGLSPHSIPQQQGHELSLPPPPPYPHGSALVNNFVKGGRYPTTSTGSPLLVNLLQTEPSLAGINNFMHSKMLPPPETGSPPKKKRRQRKPKEKPNATVSETQSQSPSTPLAVPSSEGEVSIQSVPNPALATCGLPLVTSGSSSNMPSIPMVTQALPASTQPAVTFSGRQPIHPPHSPSHQSMDTNLHTVTSTAASNLIPLSQEPIPRKSESGDVSQFLPENTAGKIINPYTGLLEPMENSSDTSPIKSDSSLDGFSPHKNPIKRSPKDKKQPPSGISPNKHLTINNVMHQGRMPPSSDRISSVPSSSAGHPSVNYSRQQHQQNETVAVYSSSSNNLMLPSSSSSSLSSVSSMSPSPLPLMSPASRGNSGYVHSSPTRKDSVTSVYNSNSTQNRTVNRSPAGQEYMPVSSASQGFVTKSPTSSSQRSLPGFMPGMSTTVEMQPLHQSVYKSLTSGFPEDNHLTTVCCGAHTTTSASPTLSQRQQQQHVATNVVTASTQQKMSSAITSPSNSEQLLNPHVMNHPAKHASVVGTSTNCLIDSPGGDSENSSQSSLLHEHSSQNDIAASGCTLEQETKVYNHDSGIGSSSERSDGTPSEPGDDFKAAHANSEDCSASIKHFLDGINKTTCVPKSDAQVITVGYAMSNSHVNKNTLKHNSDISSILSMPMEKALNHQTFNHVNCRKDKTKVMNHVGPSHQNTVLHWSTREKIFSNQVESNKRKSPKQFLREECVAQVMTNKQKLPPYTADHLKHMQKMDPLMPQHGNCNSTFGGADVHATMSTFSHGINNMGKTDESRRVPFSTQQDVVRSTVPSHKVNSHTASSCTSPRSSMMSDDTYRMCNKDYNNVQPMTNNIMSRPPTGQPGASVASFSSPDTSQPNVSHYYPQKSFPRNHQVDKRTKSPLANNPMSVASSQPDNVIPSTGMMGFGKSPDGVHSVNYSTCISDVMSNGPVTSKLDSGRFVTSSSGSYDPQKYITSATSTNKRRSPASSMINSLPQHFFDPALPLAKRLTESVQKLVKPLPSIDQSSLPHAQHKSPVNMATKSQASNSPPRLTRTAPDIRLSVSEAAMVGKFVKSNSPFDMDTAAPPHLSAEIPSLMACRTHEDGLVNNQDCLPISSHPSIKDDFQALPSQESSVSFTGSSTHHTFPNCDSNVPVHSEPNSESVLVNPIQGRVHSTNDSTNGGTKGASNTPTESWTATLETQPNSSANSASGSSSIYPLTTANSASVGGSVLQMSTPSLKQKGTSHIGATRSDCVSIYTTGGGIPTHTGSSTNTDNKTSAVAVEAKHKFEQDEQTGHSPSKVTLNCNGNECNSSSTENSKNCSPNLLLNCSANNNLCTNTSQCPEITSSRAECVGSAAVDGITPTCANTDNLHQQHSGDSTASHVNTLQNCEDVNGEQPGTLSQIQYTANSSVQSMNRSEKEEDSHVEEMTNNVPQLLPVYSDSNQVNCTDDISDSTATSVTSRPQRQTSVPDSTRPLTPDDFSTTTMALRRSRKSSESNENRPIENKPTENLSSAQHNLRLTRQRISPADPAEKEVGTRQRSNTADSQDKSVDGDSGKNLRTSSRRRKPMQNDEISATDPNKKITNLDDCEVAKHTRSSDTKDNNVGTTLKNDIVKVSANETIDGLTATLDSVKTGLRNRTQNKAPSGDEKTKVVNKDPKKKPLVSDDEIAQNKKAQLSRRSRHSPTLSQDKIQNQIRDRSPVRSRTRTLVPANTDPQEDSKRSTRSSKPRDATETLPPANKRRRSSRDHR
ncbi:uncharacterized protein LOC110443570 [Mizuhopecten yessoensis]|uniref:Nuclear receptor coactivator 6 n=1 Tax=Mizuhopecten yessoensis TaxID=6573 RepID=A0A210PEQ0_MIZYE|nr:uncharacterized protein LOC110443570 [Mizuhopecten yessoensis]XP_021343527.1 uncharacterized protein LOC110443570 [Mizuhopecten yessoensis]OWF34931.1 Nuclear receptor coactivator 6 [Mizuhopecten yessoensis]